ncbi:GATA zinc finger domain-containing protein 14 isoform X2 [Drosophila subpulchrella]|uniref:GATA zinc finger domain-containing protein 14 isoform X2 n=1 Tax=Drosophila subpulchrella TaxID=1486046 RepID=UPI0018A13E66|nr:GATA zinc finger domain-containing protein 14 isoform X2 [Drosophila subpulchrella]
MSRRSNFIEGNDNFREQNLRFVRNEFEDNINQFFGGANPGGSGQQQKPPPRDSIIVQPTAGNNELDNRREFLRELGASRMLANALAQRTLSVPNFNLRQFQRQRFRLSVELGDSRQDVVDKEVLRAIGEAVENQDEVESRPRTPPPPRNINWHNVSRDDSPVRGDRSRPRNRQRDGNFQNRRDNSRGFADQRLPAREPINRNSGPVNVSINRNQDISRNNPGGNPEDIRKNPNRNIDNRNASRPEFNRNNRIDEFSQEPARPPNNRNFGPVNAPINRNRDVNRNNQVQNPEELNRNIIPQEFNRNNRNDEFSRNNRNPSQQDFARNNRNVNSVEFTRNNRNLNPQELNRNNRNENIQTIRQDFNPNNRNANPHELNQPKRNVNPQEINHPNRNVNPQEFIRSHGNVNPQEFNRNNRNVNNDEFYRNNRNANNDKFNQHAPQGPNGNNRYATQQFNRNTNVDQTNFNTQNENIQLFNRGNPSNFNNPRINNNRGYGNQNFVTNQQTNLDRTSIINQRGNIDENFQLPRDRFQSPDNRPQQQQEHYIDQDIRDLDANVGGNPGPQTGRNYQRIVNDNQITLCRTDWIEANERNLYDNNLPEDREFIDERNGAIINDDHFRPRQPDHFRRPDVREREDRGFIQNSRGNQPSPREHGYDEGNSYGRNRNERNFDGNRRQLDRELDRRNPNDDFNQRNNSSRAVDIRRFPPREDNTFQGSNNPHFPPNQYQPAIHRGSDSVDRNRDNPQLGGPNLNRPQQGRPNVPNADRSGPRTGSSGGPNQNRTTASLDRNMKRNIIPGGPQQQRSSSRSNINPGVQSQPKSNSIASQDRNATRNVNSGGPNQGRPNQARDGKPGMPSQDKKIRGPNQKKLNQPAGVPRNTNPGAAGPGQQSIKPKPSGLATTNNAAMVNPRAGQKRKAESAELGAPNRAKKTVPKLPKVDTNRSFIIGGMRLPYINSNLKKLPQAEEESYAVTFFEQTPIYNTNMYATDNGENNRENDEDEGEEDVSDTESLESNRSGLQSKIKKRDSKKLRAQLRREWTKVYRTNNYKDWHAWWRDYKWCGSAINKKLEKFGDRNLRHRFKVPGKVMTEEGINQIFKSGHMGLEKNTFSHYRNMRSIYLLMNDSFLESLSVTQIEDLQELIRGIPNHLWLYKIRAMVYLWERYHGALKSAAPKNMLKAKEIQLIAKTWKNPTFHWLAKQAFDELKAISEIAWPDFNKIYPGLKA